MLPGFGAAEAALAGAVGDEAPEAGALGSEGVPDAIGGGGGVTGGAGAFAGGAGACLSMGCMGPSCCATTGIANASPIPASTAPRNEKRRFLMSDLRIKLSKGCPLQAERCPKHKPIGPPSKELP